jgi:hypothetical protein
MRVLLHATITLSCIILLSSCAISYQNENRRGIFGFAWLEYRAENDGKNSSSLKIGKEVLGEVAPVVQQKTLGLYLDVSGNSPGMGFGYRDVIVVVPASDAETRVDYDTSDPLSSILRVDRNQ